MPEFDRLLLFRALRPDRLTAAMARFVANVLGAQYTTSQPFDLERSFKARCTYAHLKYHATCQLPCMAQAVLIKCWNH